MTGVKNGTLHQGIFNVSPYNYLEGSGDVVVIEVLPKDQWKEPSTKIIEEETMNKDENPDADEGESVVTERERRALQEEVKKTHSKGTENRPQPTARVVGVVKRNWRQCG
ncbi:mitotic control dis3 protein [Rutstroemia sp. NJR-2017a BBW]|nr:mitotic control dis3 protein [Rutstroemia sp. NJR-2017a BBW]